MHGRPPFCYGVQITSLHACWLWSPSQPLCLGGLCTSNRKEKGKTPREKEGHKPPFEAESSAFWHHLTLLGQDGQPMAHASLNTTQPGLSFLPSSPPHSCCNRKILIRAIEKVNRKCPTSKVFPKDTWRRSWRNCLLVTKQ